MAEDKNTSLQWLVVGAVAAAAVAAALGTALFRGETSNVTATNGLAAGGDVSVGGNVVLNEFDREQQRRREVNRFVASMSRECTAFFDEVRARAVTDKASGNMPNLIGYSYALMPELPRIVDQATLSRLHEEQARLTSIHGELFQIQLAQELAAFARSAASQANAERPDGAAAFETKKSEALQVAEAHCGFIRSLQK